MFLWHKKLPEVMVQHWLEIWYLMITSTKLVAYEEPSSGFFSFRVFSFLVLYHFY
jgi:hypothetical protein